MGHRIKSDKLTTLSQNFIGNCDHFTPVINTFNPVTARYVKILVGKSAYPCMRLELYGCDV